MAKEEEFKLNQIAIDRIESVAVRADGRAVTVFFRGAGDDHAVLEFDALKLNMIVNDLAGALEEARKRSDLTAQGVVRASEPTRHRIGWSADNETLLMSFEMPNGMQHHFAFQPTAANELHTKFGQVLNQRGKKPERH